MQPDNLMSGACPPPQSSYSELIGRIRLLASAYLPAQMEQLSALVDDRLFHLSGKVSGPDVESEYFQTMRLLRREAVALREEYLAAMLREFDRFWGIEKPAAPEAVPETPPPLGGLNLSLVTDDAFEEDLAVSGMAEKGGRLYGAKLYSLNQRLAVVAGREDLRERQNPLAPIAFCRAFGEALRPLPLDVPTKLLIYKLFDQAVLQNLADFYGQVDRLLSEWGITPVAARNSIGNGLADTAGKPYRPEAHTAGFADGSAVSPDTFLQFFEELQEFLDQWRGRVGIYPKAYDVPAAPPEAVMAALESLQRSPSRDGVGAGSIKSELHQYLARTAEHPRTLARREEDAIDMVGMLFDFILDDPLLPDSVKILIARLQVPVVKVAILERAFFGRKNHPVRLLLNALAQAGMGLDLDQGGRDRAVLSAIEGAVERVLDEFEQNSLMFASVLDEFMVFMERDAQRSRVVEERTLQSSQTREQLLLCKRRVAREIAIRVHGKPVPTPIRSFLFNHWKDVMLLAYLRRGRSAGEWDRSLAVLDSIIERLGCRDGTGPATHSAADWAGVMQSIKAGLESVSFNPIMVRATLNDLNNCLGPSQSQAAPAPIHGRVEIRDPELLNAINEIKDSLPPVEKHGLEELCGPRLAAGMQQSPAALTEQLASAGALPLGTWVEFLSDERAIRAKLSWKSQVSETLVFVNRKGTKVVEKTLAELAESFANQSARFIEEANVPLMDRALDALLSTLKGCPVEPLPEPAPAG